MKTRSRQANTPVALQMVAQAREEFAERVAMVLNVLRRRLGRKRDVLHLKGLEAGIDDRDFVFDVNKAGDAKLASGVCLERL